MDALPNETAGGIVPSGWEVHTVGTALRLINGRAFKPNEWKNDGFPIIRIQNLNDPEAQFNYVVGSIEERHFIRSGDLLFAWSGTTGSSFGARIWRGPDGVLNQHIFKVIPDQRKLTPLYALLVLQNIQGAIERQAHGFKASFVHVKKSDLIKLDLPLPQLDEQRIISETLSDVDALLSGLERLIAKKRDLKQAAAQQLLSGQTRLPGFSGEWEAKRLADLGTFLKGRGVSRNEAQSGDIPCVRYGEIYTTHQDVILSFSSWISRDVAATATRLRCGDILFTASGETKEEIGKCAAFVSEQEAYAGGDIVILRPHRTDSVFLGYLLNTDPINRQKRNLGQGDAVVHIRATALASIRVSVPKIDEQEAVAEVISDMDSEIAALRQRRNKTAALKQAMMRELLSGRTRLV